MTPTECVQLIAFLRMRSPQTWLVEGTPDAWYPDLSRYDLDDGRAAVVQLSQRLGAQPISLGDLLATIRAIRNLRISRQEEPAPDADPDDPQAYLSAIRTNRRQLAALPVNPDGQARVQAAIASVTPPRPPEDETVRTERRRMLRTAVTRRRVEAEAKARAEHAERLAAARAELAAMKAGAQ